MRSSAGLRPLFFAGLSCIGAAACGGSAPPMSPTASAPIATMAPKSVATPAAQPLPPSSIRRSQVRAVIAAGPGAFLQRVSLDDKAVFTAGKFHGFRVQKLNDPSMQGVDLKTGDVVTHINGFPIEHPEEALEAFKSLEVSSELRVEYEREGVPRELRYAIVDDDDGTASPGSAAPAPAVKTTK